MRRLSKVGLIGIIAITSVLASHARSNPKVEESVTYVQAYSVHDLPVWGVLEDGSHEFDPSVLISLIRSSVAAETWDDPSVPYSDRARIVPYAARKTLIVSQSNENHEKIGKVLASLRRQTTSEKSPSPVTDASTE